MKSKLIVAGAALVVGANNTFAMLSGIVAYSADSTGGIAGLGINHEVWHTEATGPTAALWLSAGGFSGVFLNGPQYAQAGISLPLNVGPNVFYLHAGSAPSFSHFGISLFFDGDSLHPGISAGAPLSLTDSGPVGLFFPAAAGSSVPRLDGLALVSGAANLTCNSGGQSVTLTEFEWFDPSVHPSDRVSFVDTAPDGILDYAARITLFVQPVPEPTAAVLILMGLGGLVVRQRKQIGN